MAGEYQGAPSRSSRGRRRDSLGSVTRKPGDHLSHLRCSVCGKEHDLSESEVGYQLPDEYFAIGEAERAKRGRATDDVCELDGRSFIRGLLIVPVRGEVRDFGWGVWAEVSESVFRHYLETWSNPDQSKEPPFPGHLANSLPGYEQTMGLSVELKLSGPTTRPLFTVLDPVHVLGRDQREGIPFERVLEIMAPFWHPDDTGHAA